jgi:hypothetical protein
MPFMQHRFCNGWYCCRQPSGPNSDPQLIEARHLVARKQQQLGHLEAYDEAIVAFKAKIKEAEGQDMREAIQDKVGHCQCDLRCLHQKISFDNCHLQQ